jgi:DNA polymerase III delta subunit
LARADRLGLSFEAGAAEHLAKATGHDLGTIDAELAKLSALPDQAPITIEKIGQLVGVRRGETLYDWRDAVLGGQTARALELTDVVLGQAGVTPVKMATVIGSSLVGVSLARGHYDRGKRGPALASELTATLTGRLRPYWLKDIGWSVEAGRWAGWAAAWAPSGISRAITTVLAADQTLKNTRVSEERSILLDLILQLDQVRREAA